MTAGKQPQRDGFRIRRTAVELGIPCFTSLDTLTAFLEAVRFLHSKRKPRLMSLTDYYVLQGISDKGVD